MCCGLRLKVESVDDYMIQWTRVTLCIESTISSITYAIDNKRPGFILNFEATILSLERDVAIAKSVLEKAKNKMEKETNPIWGCTPRRFKMFISMGGSVLAGLGGLASQFTDTANVNVNPHIIKWAALGLGIASVAGGGAAIYFLKKSNDWEEREKKLKNILDTAALIEGTQGTIDLFHHLTSPSPEKRSTILLEAEAQLGLLQSPSQIPKSIISLPSPLRTALVELIPSTTVSPQLLAADTRKEIVLAEFIRTTIQPKTKVWPLQIDPEILERNSRSILLNPSASEEKRNHSPRNNSSIEQRLREQIHKHFISQPLKKSDSQRNVQQQMHLADEPPSTRPFFPHRAHKRSLSDNDRLIREGRLSLNRHEHLIQVEDEVSSL